MVEKVLILPSLLHLQHLEDLTQNSARSQCWAACFSLWQNDNILAEVPYVNKEKFD